MPKRNRQAHLLLTLFLLVTLGLSACGNNKANTTNTHDTAIEDGTGTTGDVSENIAVTPSQPEAVTAKPAQNATCDSRDEVALYLYYYGELPQNYITKKEAKALGWDGGPVESVAPGKCIGGDYFGNYEGLLPESDDIAYHECDIDTLGKESRGAKRLIYANDGSIYYTSDHYASFSEATFSEENDIVTVTFEE